jgi:hypothetical protein
VPGLAAVVADDGRRWRSSVSGLRATVRVSWVRGSVGRGAVAELRGRSTTVPRSTVPRSTVPRSTVPRSTVPRGTVPRSTVPRSTVHRSTVPKSTVPRSTKLRGTEPGSIVARLMPGTVARLRGAVPVACRRCSVVA